MRYGPFILALFAVSGLRAGFASATPPGPADPPAAEPEEPAVLGAPPAFDLSGELAEQIRVEAGDRLHRAPAARSPVLTSFTAATELPVLERRGDWARVRYASWKGWVRLGGTAAVDEAGLGEDFPATWATFTGPDPEHLERARALLAHERRLSLGPYELLTDVTDDPLLGELAGVAARLPEAFQRRYGLAAAAGAGETVVLYASDAAYRAYAGNEEGLAELESSGHAFGGLAVLAAGDRRRDEVRSLLVHELTHLLSYRALGPRLPSWLAEGLAEDLAYCRARRTGELELGSLDVWRSIRSETAVDARGRLQSVVVRTRGGPELALEELRGRWEKADRPSFATLLEMPYQDFTVPEGRPIHYPMSAFLVRYLLASEELADRFRGFLAALARGDEGDGEALLSHLGVGWEDLETGFSEWLFGIP